MNFLNINQVTECQGPGHIEGKSQRSRKFAHSVSHCHFLLQYGSPFLNSVFRPGQHSVIIA